MAECLQFIAEASVSGCTITPTIITDYFKYGQRLAAALRWKWLSGTYKFGKKIVCFLFFYDKTLY